MGGGENLLGVPTLLSGIVAVQWLFSATCCGHIIWAFNNNNSEPLVFELGSDLYAVETLLVVVPAFYFNIPLRALP